MTNRCEYLKSTVSQRGNNAVECTGEEKQCPKDRLKCIVGQSCWQVRNANK